MASFPAGGWGGLWLGGGGSFAGDASGFVFGHEFLGFKGWRLFGGRGESHVALCPHDN